MAKLATQIKCMVNTIHYRRNIRIINLFRRPLMILLLLQVFFSANAITVTSTATGNWNIGGTWVGGVAPGSSDNVVISSGNTVTLVGSYTTTGSLTVTGTLQLAGNSITSGDLQGAGIITSSSGTPIHLPGH